MPIHSLHNSSIPKRASHVLASVHILYQITPFNPLLFKLVTRIRQILQKIIRYIVAQLQYGQQISGPHCANGSMSSNSLILGAFTWHRDKEAVPLNRQVCPQESSAKLKEDESLRYCAP